MGFLLGGTVGIGTLLFALAIGPMVHVTIPLFSRTAASARPPRGGAVAYAPE